MKIGAIVLNYNTALRAIECCKYMTVGNSELMIVVVDNGSSAADLAVLRDHCAAHEIQLVVSPVNRGYSAGNNMGISVALESDCSHVLIVNPDVLISPEDVKRLSDALGDYPGALFCGPKIIGADGRIDVRAQRFQSHDLVATYLLKFPLSRLCRGFSDRYFNSRRDFELICQCTTSSGCCVMFKREYFEMFGLFDEEFFLYSEEVVWGFNIAQSPLSLTSLYVGTASAIHDHEKNYAEVSPTTIRNRMRSDLIFCRKYLRCDRSQVLGLVLYYRAAYYAYAIWKRDFREQLPRFSAELQEVMRRYGRAGLE